MNKKELDLLMRKIAVGDDNAFALLYEKTKRGIFAFVYSYLQNYADTEDVMQETFIAVKQKAKLYKPNTDARAWLLQIAKNLSLDELRKRKQRIEKAETVAYNKDVWLTAAQANPDRLPAPALPVCPAPVLQCAGCTG